MKVIITFDYELFFGSCSGSLENSIIVPTNKLIELGQKYNVNFVFFVDSGYLLKLEELKDDYPKLKDDYLQIIEQLKLLDFFGHSIQLHIHPHWEDSYYNGKKWVFNTKRYRLHSFSDSEIDSIVYRYKKVLTDIVGNKVFAFRAGGWSIQPFARLKNSLKNHNIWLDSTVFYGGYNKSKTHFIDFRKAPKKDKWKFEDDILVEDNNGFFTEIPISTWRYNPLFYWKFAITKKFSSSIHKIYGDGKPVGASKKDIAKLLIFGGYAPVSTDGFKSLLLEDAYGFYKDRENQYFVTIGHPKAISKFSLIKLENFIKKRYKNIQIF